MDHHTPSKPLQKSRIKLLTTLTANTLISGVLLPCCISRRLLHCKHVIENCNPHFNPNENQTALMDGCQELENKLLVASGQQSNLTSTSSHMNVYCSVIWSIWSWPTWSTCQLKQVPILQSQKCGTMNAFGSWLNTR
jgi:hypothetical protein